MRVVQVKEDEKVKVKSKGILKVCSDSVPAILKLISSMGCLDLLRKWDLYLELNN